MNLNKPYLNPDKEWEFIRSDLALPDELAIFCLNEPFRDNLTSAPKYTGSSKREIDGKEELILECEVVNITPNVPTNAFAIDKTIRVYAADKGDMKDLLEQPELVETLGGK